MLLSLTLSFKIRLRRDNYNNWKQILDRIGNIEIAIPEDRSPKSRLLCLMLKSASYCHMGRAKEALKFNSKARQFAAERGFSSEFRRLEIEELVELQDEERFEEILDLSKTIAADDFDLQMRYHGTMGQAHSYGYLSGIDGFSKEMAKRHFEEALKYAYMLDSEPDISQDLNYMYLWYALFDPASRESEEAYAKARNHIKCNLQDLEKSRKRNVFFLKRIRLMSYYRRMLGADKVSDLDYQKEKLPDEADNWLRALACKYLGAIAAANGIMDLSERLFEEGIELMPLPDSPGILSCIRMSILMEYYKSLGKTKHLETAKRELSSLLNTFPIIASKWLKFLKGSSDYPALSYWY